MDRNAQTVSMEVQKDSAFYSESDDYGHNVSMDSPDFVSRRSTRRKVNSETDDIISSQNSDRIASDAEPKTPYTISARPAAFASPCPEMYPPSPEGQASPYIITQDNETE